MTDIAKKLADVRGIASEQELARLRSGLADPQQVVCPFNKRYVALPAACTGYQYICPHLDRQAMACAHPQKQQRRSVYMRTDKLPVAR